ncbi:protein NLRC3-like [Thalassophryne amazonica]|uniref:protein NLRC3-like n=1 Tax=Thalassophryne amazonica TaxID=390379 RepID=UPI001470CEF8|nr:protein NLRC3-like [Thalassophryne amazonica]
MAPSARQHQARLNRMFMNFGENMVMFVKNELKSIQKVLLTNDAEYLESHNEDEEQRSSRLVFLYLTVTFMRRMNYDELADCLQSRTRAEVCRHKFKCKVKQKFERVFEGISKAGKTTLLKEIYIELYITEGGASEVNQEHEVRQIDAASRKTDTRRTIPCEDIFKASADTQPLIRTVLTKGVAGIGKTVLTQKWTLDWAEGQTNQDFHFIFPFTFRELNVLKEKKFSLVELVHHFFPETKEAEICSFQHFQVLIILDGLDECRLPLDFHSNDILSDVTESSSVDVLLTNLIRRNLFPSSRLWITTRPAAASQIPPECVDMVTEVRGFTDLQKEEYFRKRFRDEEQSRRIISHLKTSQSLHIMCHIPVFCWVTAIVLENMLDTKDASELPETLTEMYIYFLVVQSRVKKVKYDGGAQTEQLWNPENREMIVSLGKLAFEQLQKGKLIFYEEDLTESGIDIGAASVYSGVFTQIFKEERGLSQDTVFCFIHPSVQQFLAALYVHLTIIHSGVNLLSKKQTTSRRSETSEDKLELTCLHQSAVVEALESPNGHLDLFLHFLLGLSLQTNQTLLRGLMIQTDRISETNQETVGHIKKKVNENLSSGRSINLIHCLNELKDHSLADQIQQLLNSRSLSEEGLSPSVLSALIFILRSSDQHLDVFDLKKYSALHEALLVLPVIKESKKAFLSGCNLSERSCEVLSSVQKVHVVLRDNAANMQKGLDECGVKSLGCMAHKIQLAVHNGLISQRSVSDCVAIGRRLVEHFKHSQLATSRLRGIQTDLGLPNKTLQQDVTTRWNSMLYMMKSLLEQKRVLRVYGTDHELPVSFTMSQWSLIENMTALLSPFEQLTLEISSHSASAADVILAVVALKRLLSKTVDTDAGVGTAKATLLEAINKCFTSRFSEPHYYLATILDPRYKDCYFDTTLRATAITELQQEIHRMTNENEKKSPEEEEEPGEKRCRLSDERQHSLMDMYAEILEERQSSEQHPPDKRSSLSAHNLNDKRLIKVKGLRKQHQQLTTYIQVLEGTFRTWNSVCEQLEGVRRRLEHVSNSDLTSTVTVPHGRTEFQRTRAQSHKLK